MKYQCGGFDTERDERSTLSSSLSHEDLAARAVVLVDHAVVHAAGDEAAAKVAPEGAERHAPDPGLGAAAAGALHPRLDQLAAVGTRHRDGARPENDLHGLVDHYHGRWRLLVMVHDRLLLEHWDRSRWSEPLFRMTFFLPRVWWRLRVHDEV